MKCNNCENGIMEPFTTLGGGDTGYACNICGNIAEDKGFDPNSNTAWVRLGANVTLPKPINEYADEDALREDLIAAIKSGNYELDGDSYIPSGLIGNKDEIGFDL